MMQFVRSSIFLFLLSCSDDDTCPEENLSELNSSLPADCGCGQHFENGCPQCELYVDGERIGFFNADCRDITCCHR